MESAANGEDVVKSDPITEHSTLCKVDLLSRLQHDGAALCHHPIAPASVYGRVSQQRNHFGRAAARFLSDDCHLR